MNITVFCEYNPAMETPEGKKAYPETMHECLRTAFSDAWHTANVFVQREGCGAEGLLPLLEKTDVLVWWGHAYHGNVEAVVSDAVTKAVWRGMGIIFLHSAHKSKPFMQLLGTDGSLRWREINENERLWVVEPSHPIANGIALNTEIPEEEMYGEPFGIPRPDELVFIGWFKGGEVMRSGCVFNRGRGKIFYFQPGHETNPTYRLPAIRQILQNAAEYVKSPAGVAKNNADCPNVKPLENIR